jgi:molybdate transport system substrate-binding protein
MRLIALILGLATCFARAASAETVRVGVAVSLKEAVTEITKSYTKTTGNKVTFTFGSSGQIMAQIQAGAPLDAFISAADKQVDELEKAGLVEQESRRVVAGNTLVLIVPTKSRAKLDSFESLAKQPIKRLATGDPKSVPAGQYAKQVFEKLKLNDALKDKIVYGGNVRQVLDYVVRDEVTAGVVYATDAKEAGDKVKVVAEAPKDSHDAIAYPAIVIKNAARAAAAGKFLDHLASEDARKALNVRGFKVPEAASAPAGRRP